MTRIFISANLLLCYATMFGQNVGIGINSPQEKLEVAGNVLADTIKQSAFLMTTNAGANKVMTSDANGNGTWQEMSGSSTESGYGVWGGCDYNVSNYQAVADSAGSSVDVIGFVVAIHGDFAMVGNYTKTVGSNANQGVVNVYKFYNGRWNYFQTLMHPNGHDTDFFGESIAMTDEYAVISCKLDDVMFPNDNYGSAQIFKYNGTNWNFHQEIVHVSPNTDDLFGYPVAIDGNFIVVGVKNDDDGTPNSGSIQIYELVDNTWVYNSGLSDVNMVSADNYTTSIAISGNYIAVGSNLDDAANMDQGSVNIFKYNGSTWNFHSNLLDSSGGVNDQFGYAVSLSGAFLAVGSRLDDGTVVDQGSVVVYQLVNDVWIQKQKLMRVDGVVNDMFGISVSMSGDYLLVGCSNDDLDTGSNQGSATLYYRVGSKFRELEYITDKSPSNNDQFGTKVDINGAARRFIIGVPQFDTGKGMVVFGKVK